MLIERLKKMEKENKDNIEALEKKNKENIDALKKALEKKNKENIDALKNTWEIEKKEMKTHMDTLEKNDNMMKEEIKNLKYMLGSVQIRDLAKNFLRNFSTYLTIPDLNIIKKDKKKKWEMIVKRVEEYYIQYQHSPKFNAFVEVLKKSENIIKEGNSFPHNLSLELLEKEIIEISKKYNIFPNTEKLCFLLYLRVSEDLFINCYDFL